MPVAEWPSAGGVSFEYLGLSFVPCSAGRTLAVSRLSCPDIFEHLIYPKVFSSTLLRIPSVIYLSAIEYFSSLVLLN
jgi:hypothetical protein